MSNKGAKILGVRLPEPLRSQFEEAAERAERRPSDLARIAIKRMLQEEGAIPEGRIGIEPVQAGKSPQIGVRIPPHHLAQLKAEAEKQDVQLSRIVRRAIKLYLTKDLEEMPRPAAEEVIPPVLVPLCRQVLRLPVSARETLAAVVEALLSQHGLPIDAEGDTSPLGIPSEADNESSEDPPESARSRGA